MTTSKEFLVTLALGVLLTAGVASPPPLRFPAPEGHKSVRSCEVSAADSVKPYKDAFACISQQVADAAISKEPKIERLWFVELAGKTEELARRASYLAADPAFPYVYAAKINLTLMLPTTRSYHDVPTDKLCARAYSLIESAAIADKCGSATSNQVKASTEEANRNYEAVCGKRVDFNAIAGGQIGPQCHAHWSYAFEKGREAYFADLTAKKLGLKNLTDGWIQRAEALQETTKSLVLGTGPEGSVEKASTDLLQEASAVAPALALAATEEEKRLLVDTRGDLQAAEGQLVRLTKISSAPPPTCQGACSSLMKRETATLQSAIASRKVVLQAQQALLANEYATAKALAENSMPSVEKYDESVALLKAGMARTKAITEGSEDLNRVLENATERVAP